jgi:hypothetical protein
LANAVGIWSLCSSIISCTVSITSRHRWSLVFGLDTVWWTTKLISAKLILIPNRKYTATVNEDTKIYPFFEKADGRFS